MNAKKKLAVITGASSGMGLEFAKAIAQTESLDEMWLIARRLDRLLALKNVLETQYPTISFRAISLDLALEESIQAYRMLLEKADCDLRILVNGSGFGKFGSFSDISMEEYAGMIDLNSKSLVLMTYASLCLPLPREEASFRIWHRGRKYTTSIPCPPFSLFPI